MSGYVIVHKDMGVYLGACLGLGFWTLLDPVGQPGAVVFDSVDQARDYISSWENNNDPNEFEYVKVRNGDISSLKEAGLEVAMGSMEEDALRYAETEENA